MPFVPSTSPLHPNACSQIILLAWLHLAHTPGPHQSARSTLPGADLLSKQEVQAVECSLEGFQMRLVVLHQGAQRETGKGPGLHHRLHGMGVPPGKGRRKQRREELDGQLLQGRDGQGLVLQQALAGQLQESGWGGPDAHPEEPTPEPVMGGCQRARGGGGKEPGRPCFPPPSGNPRQGQRHLLANKSQLWPHWHQDKPLSRQQQRDKVTSFPIPYLLAAALNPSPAGRYTPRSLTADPHSLPRKLLIITQGLKTAIRSSAQHGLSLNFSQ